MRVTLALNGLTTLSKQSITEQPVFELFLVLTLNVPYISKKCVEIKIK